MEAQCAAPLRKLSRRKIILPGMKPNRKSTNLAGPKKKILINTRNTILITSLLLLIMAISPSSGAAAEFSLAWDPNCNVNPTLIGYTIYYSAGSPVTADPDGADIVYISLDDPDFDPDQPAFEITDLEDDVEYYFTVTAIYEDGESDMSNEVSGTNSHTETSPDSNLQYVNSNSTFTGSSSGGCFINILNEPDKPN
jgi:hypothetical protein